jgi:hypothetical protein
MLPPLSPDFLSELTPSIRRCAVNHRDGITHGHIPAGRKPSMYVTRAERLRHLNKVCAVQLLLKHRADDLRLFARELLSLGQRCVFFLPLWASGPACVRTGTFAGAASGVPGMSGVMDSALARLPRFDQCVQFGEPRDALFISRHAFYFAQEICRMQNRNVHAASSVMRSETMRSNRQKPFYDRRGGAASLDEYQKVGI